MFVFCILKVETFSIVLTPQNHQHVQAPGAPRDIDALLRKSRFVKLFMLMLLDVLCNLALRAKAAEEVSDITTSTSPRPRNGTRSNTLEECNMTGGG